MNTFRPPPALIITGAALIMLICMGIRQTFGLFLHPMTTDLGWSRETFALALALQSLVFGLVQPPIGYAADRWGSGRVIMAGALLYAGTLYLISSVTTPLVWNLAGGLMLGVAMASTGMPVLAGAAGRLLPEERRSSALGAITSAGGMGQFLMLMSGQALISFGGWQMTLLIFAALPLLMIPFAIALTGRREALPAAARLPFRDALGEALGHRGYLLLTAGFFVCGFQVVFIGAHLPAFLMDNHLAPAMGATALSLIGFFNIIGSYLWGRMGGRRSKKNLLSTIYLLRSGVIALFIFSPITETSVLLFSAAIGFLWLGTVPLTSGLVGQIFGVQYLSTLFGIVFVSHQVGSFLGAWLGGFLFDLTGAYDVVWYIAIGLGLIAALLHMPINEAEVERLRLARQLT